MNQYSGNINLSNTGISRSLHYNHFSYGVNSSLYDNFTRNYMYGKQESNYGILHINENDIIQLSDTDTQLSYIFNKMLNSYSYKSLLLHTKSQDYLSVRLYNSFSAAPFILFGYGDEHKFKMTISWNDKYATNQIKCKKVGKPYLHLSNYDFYTYYKMVILDHMSRNGDADNMDGALTFVFDNIKTNFKSLSDISSSGTYICNKLYSSKYQLSRFLNHPAPETFITTFNNIEEAVDCYIHIPKSIYLDDSTNWRPLPITDKSLYNTTNVVEIYNRDNYGSLIITDGEYELNGELTYVVKNLLDTNNQNFKITNVYTDLNYIIGNTTLPCTTIPDYYDIPYACNFEEKFDLHWDREEDNCHAVEVPDILKQIPTWITDRYDRYKEQLQHCIDYESSIYNIPNFIKDGASDEDFNLKSLARYSLRIGSFYQNDADISSIMPLLWIKNYKSNDINSLYNFNFNIPGFDFGNATNIKIYNYLTAKTHGNWNALYSTDVKYEKYDTYNQFYQIFFEGMNKNTSYSEISTRGEFENNFKDGIQYMNLNILNSKSKSSDQIGINAGVDISNTDFWIKYIHRYGLVFDNAMIPEGNMNYELGEDLAATELFYTKLEEPMPPDIMDISTELNVGQKICIGWDLYGIPDENIATTNCRTNLTTSNLVIIDKDCNIGNNVNEFCDINTKFKPVSIIFKKQQINNINNFRPNMTRFKIHGLYHSRRVWDYDERYLDLNNLNELKYLYVADPLNHLPNLTDDLTDLTKKLDYTHGHVIPTSIHDLFEHGHNNIKLMQHETNDIIVHIPHNESVLIPKTNYTYIVPGNRQYCTVTYWSDQHYLYSIDYGSSIYKYDKNKLLNPDNITIHINSFNHTSYNFENHFVRGYFYLACITGNAIKINTSYDRVCVKDQGSVYCKRNTLYRVPLPLFSDVPVSTYTICDDNSRTTMFDLYSVWESPNYKGMYVSIPHIYRDMLLYQPYGGRTTYYGEFIKVDDRKYAVYNGIRDDPLLNIGSRIMDYATIQINRSEYLKSLQLLYGETYLDECKYQDIVTNEHARIDPPTNIYFTTYKNSTNTFKVNQIKTNINNNKATSSGYVTTNTNLSLSTYLENLNFDNVSDSQFISLNGFIDENNNKFSGGTIYNTDFTKYRPDYFIELIKNTNTIMGAEYDNDNNFKYTIKEYDFSVRSYTLYAVNRIVDVDKTTYSDDILYTLEKPIIVAYNTIEFKDGNVRIYEKYRNTNKIFASKILNAYLVGKRQEIFPSSRLKLYTDNGEIRLNNTYLPIWYDKCEINFRHEVNTNTQPDPWINIPLNSSIYLLEYGIHIENYDSQLEDVYITTYGKPNDNRIDVFEVGNPLNIIDTVNIYDISNINNITPTTIYIKINNKYVVHIDNWDKYKNSIRTNFLRTYGRPAIRPKGVYTDPNVAILFDAPTRHFLHYDDHIILPSSLAKHENLGVGCYYNHPYFSPETFFNCSYSMFFSNNIPKQAVQNISFNIGSDEEFFTTIRSLIINPSYLLFEVFLQLHQNRFVEKCIGSTVGTDLDKAFNQLMYASHTINIDGKYTTLGIFSYLKIINQNSLDNFNLSVLIIFIFLEALIVVPVDNMKELMKIFQKYCVITKVPVTQIQIILTCASYLTYNNNSSKVSLHNKVCSGINISRLSMSGNDDLNVTNKADVTAKTYGYVKTDNGYDEISGPFETLAASPIAFMERIAISTAIDYFNAELINYNAIFNYNDNDNVIMYNNTLKIDLSLSDIPILKTIGSISSPLDIFKYSSTENIVNQTLDTSILVNKEKIKLYDNDSKCEIWNSIASKKNEVRISDYNYKYVIEDIFNSFQHYCTYSLFKSVVHDTVTKDNGEIEYKYVCRVNEKINNFIVDYNESKTIIVENYNINDDNNLNVDYTNKCISGFGNVGGQCVSFHDVISIFEIFSIYLSRYNNDIYTSTLPFSSFFSNIAPAVVNITSWSTFKISNIDFDKILNIYNI